MKKLFVLVLASIAFLYFSGIVLSQDKWYQVNQFTARWDAVTTDIDGDPLPPETTLKYRFWMANAVTDPNLTNPVQVAESTDPNATITVGTKGQFYVGVSAVIVYIDGSELPSPGINWAHLPEDQGTTQLWAIRHHAPPPNPNNLIRQ